MSTASFPQGAKRSRSSRARACGARSAYACASAEARLGERVAEMNDLALLRLGQAAKLRERLRTAFRAREVRAPQPLGARTGSWKDGGAELVDGALALGVVGERLRHRSRAGARAATPLAHELGGVDQQARADALLEAARLQMAHLLAERGELQRRVGGRCRSRAR